MKKIILASTSPRRSELLKQMGVDFDVVPAIVSESVSGKDANTTVHILSKRKCFDVAEQLKGKDVLVIGADTVVVFGNLILGKPATEADAFKLLKVLSGKKHTVITGVTIKDCKTGKTETFSVETIVKFYDLSDEEITEYIKTGEPMDKAGGYGIQGRGALFVEFILGDYNNVVGLPISRLAQVLKTF